MRDQHLAHLEQYPRGVNEPRGRVLQRPSAKSADKTLRARYVVSLQGKAEAPPTCVNNETNKQINKNPCLGEKKRLNMFLFS